MKIYELLSKRYNLRQEQIQFFQECRFVKLKHVLSEEVIKYYNEIISAKVVALNKMHVPLAERSTYDRAFLQIFNLWTVEERIKRLILSPRLGQIAAELMRVEAVKLYHDQALYKEGGGGITPWHADQHYWPLDSDKTVTAWIPLQTTPLEMGPLEFSARSHEILTGRELAIGDESESILQRSLTIADFEHVVEPFDIGEVSFHSGWVFHRAGANVTGETRKVMTIIYMDKEMRLIEPTNKDQINDWHTWCPGVEPGQIIDSALNPIIAKCEAT
jgi:hypothetical protein